ncbi:MAG: T9SS type A sorting domain-containing protein [Lewinella sp.]|nr:T9SS type A sorting domain-containing protein [Lewinella sp.]
MKNLKFLLLLLLAIISVAVYGQGDEPPISDVVESIEVLEQSPANIPLLANAVVLFEDQASVYLQWEAVPEAAGYTLRYRPAGDEYWTNTAVNGTAYILSGLPLGMDFEWSVSGGEAISGQGAFATVPQEEPIQVSSRMFNGLSDWFAHEGETTPFCEYVETMDAHLYEKLAFIQAYSRENAPFTTMGNAADLSSWFPDTAPGTEGYCAPPPPPPVSSCHCKVITMGSGLASPGTMNGNGTVSPKVSSYIARAPNDRTYVDRNESGAAKFVSLRQDEGSGGMSYEMSNLNVNGGSTTAVSQIQFFLACLDGNTNLPEECACERPLYVNYSYSTSMKVLADPKSCWFSKGAAAQAEDMAMVVAYNGRSGDMSVLAGGHGMISRHFNSSWNPDFWIEVLNVANPVAQFFVGGSSTPTPSQINQIVQALQALIGTPFRNSNGSAGTTLQELALVDGSSQFTLRPNAPVRIALFSSYYLRTRGYGCYRAQAGIASDYHLAGVVESEQTDDPECCSDKFGAYILGSLSTPPNGDVHIQAVHGLQDLRQTVGFFLSGFGVWSGANSGPFGQVAVSNEFGMLRGPSCQTSGSGHSGGGFSFRLGDSTVGEADQVSAYPTIGQDQFTLVVRTPAPRQAVVRIFNAQGALVESMDLGSLERGVQEYRVDASSWSAGIYFGQVRLNGQTYPFRFLKQ